MVQWIMMQTLAKSMCLIVNHNQLDVLAPIVAGTTVTQQEPARIIHLSNAPQSVAITSDGQLGFVALSNGQVLMLDIPRANNRHKHHSWWNSHISSLQASTRLQPIFQPHLSQRQSSIIDKTPWYPTSHFLTHIGRYSFVGYDLAYLEKSPETTV